MANDASLRLLGFNSQPPEGGWLCIACRQITGFRFQLTAARRRLAGVFNSPLSLGEVSTHSRPKAAGLLNEHGSELF